MKETSLCTAASTVGCAQTCNGPITALTFTHFRVAAFSRYARICLYVMIEGATCVSAAVNAVVASVTTFCSCIDRARTPWTCQCEGMQSKDRKQRPDIWADTPNCFNPPISSSKVASFLVGCVMHGLLLGAPARSRCCWALWEWPALWKGQRHCATACQQGTLLKCSFWLQRSQSSATS